MLTAFGRTDKGRARATNQDSFVVRQLGEDALLAVICDGMGGGNGGDVASRNAVTIIAQHMERNYRPNYTANGVRNMMLVAVSVANSMVYDMARKNEDLAGMGTTVIVCVVRQGIVHFVFAGDSRAYLVGEKGIARVTRDHSLVQLLIDRGELSEEEARLHPQKHYITRALGVAPTLDAEYGEYPLQSGQQVLLCTDGLSNYVPEARMHELVRAASPEEATATLISEANAVGGPDNITALIVSG